MAPATYFRCLITSLLLCIPGAISAQTPGKQVGARNATDIMYSLCSDTMFWSGAGGGLHDWVLQTADSATYYGLKKEIYRFPVVTNKITDKAFSQSAIAFLTDMYQGNIRGLIGNDELAHAFRGRTDSIISHSLVHARSNKEIPIELVISAQRDTMLLTQLWHHSRAGHADTSSMLAATANLYRWMRHFGFEKYIVVNIPAATLRYYEYDTVALQMKVVVGKPSTRTPRFSSWLDKIILYPYWNVPTSIATKELLPILRRNPSKLNEMNLQVLDRKGRVLNPNTLNWQSFHRGNFPYTLRQCTGCDNALGVMKFNLTDPFSVYMHDTNNKPAFMSDYRYLSHGCIRLSDPVALGNALLNNTLDTAFLAACFKNEKPQELPLAAPVPVFVVYMTADRESDSLVFYKDIYKLFR